jgi:hypothetical protein
VQSVPPAPNSVTAFGTATTVNAGPVPSGAAPLVGLAVTPDGGGYWLLGADGGVFAFGNAPFLGSLGGLRLTQPVVGMAAAPAGGYWLVAADGGVFAFGGAPFLGSLGGLRLTQPIVGMAAAPAGGYWLVAADGGVFAFGNARFQGSLGGLRLNQPIVGMAAAPTGGYWLVAADGGVFTFGNARFMGSLGAIRLSASIVGMAAAPDGTGYWLVGGDGGVFTFGNAPFLGSNGGSPVPTPAVGIGARPGGYWILYGRNPFGPVVTGFIGSRGDNVTAAIFDITSGWTFTFRPGVVSHTASTVKVDILGTLLTQAQAAGRGLTPAEQALVVPMIEQSLDSAANVLWGQLGPAAIGAFERAAGLTQTAPATNGIWGTTTTTALDRLAMIGHVVFPNSLLTDGSRAYMLSLMENVTPTQRWGISGGVPAGVTIALKNGFSVINGWQINSTGWVSGLGHNYLIAVLTDGNPSQNYGIDTINGISSLIWPALGH